MEEIIIAGRRIGEKYPTYFIADIAANHDGSLERAKMLIRLAKEAGADAVKFQNFKAENIVSDYGFKSLGNQQSHQASWKKSVFEVYKDAEVPIDWTVILKEYCDNIGIHYFSTPYDIDIADHLDAYVPAHKIGSGDINDKEVIERVAKKGKPVLIATGASELHEILRAVETIKKHNEQIVLMQCNTNYTASIENFDHIHLNVLKVYRLMFPDIILGLSDHTLGHATVLGAVTLGARVIEKHFTDDNLREGPDHKFSMTPQTWKDMVGRTRELERALGSTVKRVEENEKETVILQRKCLRATEDIFEGDIITTDKIKSQRPAPEGSLDPFLKEKIIGKRAKRFIKKEEHFTWDNI